MSDNSNPESKPESKAENKLESKLGNDPVGNRRRPSIGGGSQYLPIKTLNTYSSRWRIRARVMDKSNITPFNRGTRTGSVFSCVLMDNEGTSINCKFWNSAADKFHSYLEVGKVYTFARGKISVSNKRYSGSVAHNYEISYDTADADISICENAETGSKTDDIPEHRSIQYKSLRSVEMATTRPPYTTNIIAIPHSYRSLREVQTKNGDTAQVRNVILVDATGYSLEVSLWGDHATEATDAILAEKAPIGFENLQIRDGRLGGKQGASTRMSKMNLKLDTPEAKELRTWYLEEGETTQYKAISGDQTDGLPGAQPPVEATIKDLDERVKGGFDGVLVFKTVAYVSRVIYRNQREDDALNVMYQACSKCNRKMPDSDSTMCGTCQENVVVVPRLAFSLVLDDGTASGLVVRVFNDVAQSLLGQSAKKVEQLVKEDNTTSLNEIFGYQICWKRYAFMIRARQDMYNNELRVSLTVGSAVPVSPGNIGTMCMQRILKLIPTAFDDPARECGKRLNQPSTHDALPVKAVKATADDTLQEAA